MILDFVWKEQKKKKKKKTMTKLGLQYGVYTRCYFVDKTYDIVLWIFS